MQALDGEHSSVIMLHLYDAWPRPGPVIRAHAEDRKRAGLNIVLSSHVSSSRCELGQWGQCQI